jgi:hypothetical protein
VNLPEMLLITGVVTAIAMVVVWLASLTLHNASIVDPFASRRIPTTAAM